MTVLQTACCDGVGHLHLSPNIGVIHIKTASISKLSTQAILDAALPPPSAVHNH